MNRHISDCTLPRHRVEIGTRMPSSLKCGVFPPNTKINSDNSINYFSTDLANSNHKPNHQQQQATHWQADVQTHPHENTISTGQTKHKAIGTTKYICNSKCSYKIPVESCQTRIGVIFVNSLVPHLEGHGKMFGWWKSWGQEVFHSGCRLSQLLIPKFYCGWALESLPL